MADLCIIYAREDRKKVELLDQLFRKEGWTVWWDKHMRDGSLTDQIQQEINDPKCVLLVWSRKAVNKIWVRDEARYTLEIKRILIPVRLDSCVIPVPFGELQTFELIGWRGGDSARFRNVVTVIRRHITAIPTVWDGKRSGEISLRGKQLLLPAFFRSVSSYETQLRPDAAMKLLELLKTEAVLLSAYDLVHSTRASALAASAKRLGKSGSVVMMDSGNYEAYRKQDKKWTRTKFARSLSTKCFDYVFCFDNLRPPRSLKTVVSDVIKRTLADRELAETESVIPIVHLPFEKNGKFRTSMASDIFAEISGRLRTGFIAIPERELGGGLIEKAKVVCSIRKALNGLGRYQPIHLLGTGNPLSVAVFTAAGADSFDGLEWCRTAADYDTAHLFHFHQYDFFRDQTRRAENNLVRLAGENESISFDAKVGLHNLEFFRVWINDLQKHVHGGTLDTLLRPLIPGPFVSELRRAFLEQNA